MKKIKSRCSRIIFVSVYLLFYFSTLTGSILADYTLDMREFTSFAAAFETLPEDAGAVSMILPSNFSDAEMIIPAGRGITSLSIVPPAEPGSAYLPDIIRICANGVPLTVGEGILLENASIYGGACVSSGDVQLASSEVTISGKTAFVFGGGFADGGGRSTVTETAVTLTESGQVYLEVFGGGHAYEPDSRVSVEKTNVTVRGTADYVLGGGFAEDGGLSECDQTNVVTEEGCPSSKMPNRCLAEKPDGHFPVTSLTAAVRPGWKKPHGWRSSRRAFPKPHIPEVFLPIRVQMLMCIHPS